VFIDWAKDIRGRKSRANKALRVATINFLSNIHAAAKINVRRIFLDLKAAAHVAVECSRNNWTDYRSHSETT
jgi:hypothetical protein